MRRVLIVSLALSVLSGCQTIGERIDPTQIALAYYAQHRTYEPMKLTGVQSVTLTAAEGETIELTLSSQLEPLSIYPRDPSTLKTMLEGLTNLGTVVGASLVGLELVDGLSAGPTIVEQPAPIIVNGN